MKKKICIIILFIVVINCVYSFEERDFYDFTRNISDGLLRIRELCIMDMSGIYTEAEHYQIIEEYKSHLLNISIRIKDRGNKILFDENISIIEILTIIDYEVNNILNTNNFEINSHEILDKIDMMLELIMSIFIIKYYEPIISDYNLW
ncbi:MAG: hypothetical protein LBQ93_09345 [Treponema sp.]|nr:hypothetical protein [Treponema sp.]